MFAPSFDDLTALEKNAMNPIFRGREAFRLTSLKIKSAEDFNRFHQEHSGPPHCRSARRPALIPENSNLSATMKERIERRTGHKITPPPNPGLICRLSTQKSLPTPANLQKPISPRGRTSARATSEQRRPPTSATIIPPAKKRKYSDFVQEEERRSSLDALLDTPHLSEVAPNDKEPEYLDLTKDRQSGSIDVDKVPIAISPMELSPEEEDNSCDYFGSQRNGKRLDM